MKTTYKFLSLTVFGLLLLTACGKTSDVAPIGGITEGETMEEAILIPGEAPGRPEARLYDKEVDCSMLKNKEREEMCESQISELVAGLIQNEANRSFNAKLCDNLPSFMAEECKRNIQASGVQGPVSEDELVIFRDALNPVLPETEGEPIDPEAEITYDVTRCAQLKTPGYQTYCEKEVSQRIERNKFEKVTRDGKLQDCEKFSDEALKRECKMFFGVREEPEIIEPPVIEEAPVIEPPAIEEPALILPGEGESEGDLEI